MDGLEESVDRLAQQTDFSGVVRVDAPDGFRLERAYGLAHRGLGVSNMVDGQFGIASGTKALTALTVMSLVEQGRLERSTTARSMLGDDLPLIRDDVTIEQLLGHRSGIGDYIDEGTAGAITDHLLPVPVHELVTTDQYLAVLDGHPTVFPPGERFAYNNSGYVVLALIAERVAGTPFAGLVVDRVCVPAGMPDTRYLRSDELPGRAARGYLAVDGLRTNVLHLPVCGSGDGGIFSTAADIHALWAALFAGRIVSLDLVAEMVCPRSEVPSESKRYGLGFWLGEAHDVVLLEGFDAGVSFRTEHRPSTGFTFTVLSNTSLGAWPLARFLDECLMR